MSWYVLFGGLIAMVGFAALSLLVTLKFEKK